MSKQIINIGSVPNDGTGDALRTALDKTNLNFTELYDNTSNVDNTSDANKPVSTAQAAADAVVASNASSALNAHATNTLNPHAVTKSQVGLGNVDNTSDANKPVSTAQAAADTATLNSAKSYADGIVTGAFIDQGNYDASGNTFPTSTNTIGSVAVKKGFAWETSVAGILGGQEVQIGDIVRALVDAPGQTSTNWNISEKNLTYIPEKDLAVQIVKTTSFSAIANCMYPVDSTSGNIVVTIPTATDGDRIGFKLVIQVGTNGINGTLTGSDVINKVGGSTTFNITELNQTVIFKYKASSAIWYVVNDSHSLMALDARYTPKIVPTPFLATDAANMQSVIDAVAGAFMGYDIITYEGQSNMEGRGQPYSQYLFSQDPEIFMVGAWDNTSNKLFFKDEVVYAREPIQPSANVFSSYNQDSNNVLVGHVLAFAKEYKKKGYLTPGRRILIVGHALGGTGFLDGYWTYGSGVGYKTYIRNVKKAFYTVDKNGNPLNNKIVARLRHQGEADTGNAGYQTGLDALINGVNSDLATEYAGVIPPLIIGGLGDTYKAQDAGLVTIDNILKDTPNRIAKTWYYQANGLKSMNDIYGDGNNHFNAYSQFQMGQFRASDAFERALTNTNTATGKAPNRIYGINLVINTTNQITINWEQSPVFGTGSALTAHTLRWRVSGTQTWTNVTLGVVYTYNLTGLTTGVEYEFQVCATNAIGSGLFSKTFTGTAITISASVPQSASLKYSLPLTADANDTSGNAFHGTLLGNPTTAVFGSTVGMGSSCLISTINNQGVKNVASNAAIFSKAGIFKPNFAGSANNRMGIFQGANTKYFKLDFDKVSSVWSMRVGIVNSTTPANFPTQVITNIVDGTVLRIIVSIDNSRGSSALKIMVNGTIYNFASENAVATDTAQYYGATADLSGGNTFIGSQKAMYHWNNVALTDAEMLNMDAFLQTLL